MRYLRYMVQHQGRKRKGEDIWGWAIVDFGWERGPILDEWGLTKRKAIALAKKLNKEDLDDNAMEL
jgi:hypothetical protein